MVGAGRRSSRPVAFVFGSGANLCPTRKDYRAARAIASDHRRAGRETSHVFDLRRHPLHRLPSWLFSIVLRPADKQGRAIISDTFEGTIYRMEYPSNGFPDGLVMSTAVRGTGGIPWESPIKNDGQTAIDTRESGQQPSEESSELAAA